MNRLRFFAARMRMRARAGRYARPQSKSKPRIRVTVLLIGLMAGLLLFYVWTDMKIKPIVKQLASARVHYLAGMTVNDAINEVLTREGVDYGDLILFEKDLTGRVSAIRTNMTSVNRLKTEVCRQVLVNIENIERSDMHIPLGSVFQNNLLAGRGPRIPVRLVPVGAVNAEFENMFLAAGINQTKHQIVMKIHVDMGVLAWGSAVDLVVNAEMVIAETIIVGEVPDYYTNIGEDTIF